MSWPAQWIFPPAALAASAETVESLRGLFYIMVTHWLYCDLDDENVGLSNLGRRGH